MPPGEKPGIPSKDPVKPPEANSPNPASSSEGPGRSQNPSPPKPDSPNAPEPAPVENGSKTGDPNKPHSNPKPADGNEGSGSNGNKSNSEASNPSSTPGYTAEPLGTGWVVKDPSGKIVAKGLLQSEAIREAVKRNNPVQTPPLDPSGWGGKNPARDLEKHYDKHGDEVGAKNIQEYLDRAKSAAEGRSGQGTPVEGQTPNVRRFDVHGTDRYVDVDITTGKPISFEKNSPNHRDKYDV